MSLKWPQVELQENKYSFEFVSEKLLVIMHDIFARYRSSGWPYSQPVICLWDFLDSGKFSNTI